MTTHAPKLSGQIERLNALKDMLTQELELIVSRDADALLSLVEKKQELLDQINADERLMTLLQQPAEQLSEADADITERAKSLLKDCQHQTNVNSIAVQKNQIRIEALRRILIESRNKESMTYDKAGRAQNSSLGGGVKA
ncbi:MAG: flagellar export chaperone FlgN [Aestuariibacter sp.]